MRKPSKAKTGKPRIIPAPNSWPADRVERRPIESLIPSAKNARLHSDAQVAQIVALIREFGWTSPVLIDERGEIIAGHGRVMAAHKIGLAEVPCIVATDWTEAQKAAYRIADNAVPLNSTWDVDMLRSEIGALKTLDFDLSLLAFPESHMVEFISGLNPKDKKSTDSQIGSVKFSLVIECSGEIQQAQLLERLEGEGLKVRAMML